MPNSLVDRIFMLMDKSGKSPATLSKEIPLTNGLMTQWKQGKQMPSLDAVTKIANYFSVSIDYLVTGKEFSISKSDSAILSAYHKAEAGTQKCVDRLLGI